VFTVLLSDNPLTGGCPTYPPPGGHSTQLCGLSLENRPHDSVHDFLYISPINTDIHNLVISIYGISASQVTTDMHHLSLTLPGSFLIHDWSPGL